MNNKISSRAHIDDAEIILEEAKDSLKKRHYHRVIRKCQETTELAIKALFKYIGLEYPKSHLLGRVFKKELSKLDLFNKDEIKKIAFISDSLAFDREPAFYGLPDGTSASELFDLDDANTAIKNTEWVVKVIKKIILGL